MKITETLQFDRNEYDAFKNAFRWSSVAYSIDATDEEKKALSRVMEKRFRFTKHMLRDTISIWNKVYAELKARQETLEALSNKQETLEANKQFPECPESDRIVVHLFANPVQFCKDQSENLKMGMVEVSELISIMNKAIAVLKDVPLDEDEDSDEFLQRDIHEINVRR